MVKKHFSIGKRSAFLLHVLSVHTQVEGTWNNTFLILGNKMTFHSYQYYAEIEVTMKNQSSPGWLWILEKS